MKFKVKVCWRTVEVVWEEVEVEADSVDDAKERVEEMGFNGVIDFSSKGEVVEGSYEFGEIVEIPQEDAACSQ